MTQARPETLVRVSVRIREEVARLDQVMEAMGEALALYDTQGQDVVTTHWVGGLVHDLYTGIEKAFRVVSPDLNGLSPASDTWHRDLLHSMTLDLPGFRPPVIRASVESRLLELLKFRHLYRNLYAFRLRWDRVRELATDAASLWPEIRSDLLSFADALVVMARG